jgi:hypothetical protein
MQTTKSIREVDWGIACTSGQGNIYINRHLKSYNKELYDKVLQHERSHDIGAYNTNDLREDMSIDFFPLKEKIRFCLMHPKGWLFLSPIIITKDEIMVSWLGVFKIGIIMGLLCFILFWVI